MRHYIVDPDNAERLLKIPPSVVAEIQADALREARAAVAALDWSCDERQLDLPVVGRDDALAAIDNLRGES